MFEWTDDLSFNIKSIDQQHKRLFELGGQLYDIASSSEEFDYFDEIQKIFDELRDYTVYHFGYEEKLLEENGYDPAKLKAQKFEHAYFVSKLVRAEGKDLDEEQKQVLNDLITFFYKWIKEHILVADRQYVDLLKSKSL